MFTFTLINRLTISQQQVQVLIFSPFDCSKIVIEILDNQMNEPILFQANCPA